jgi:hypothetical protein
MVIKPYIYYMVPLTTKELNYLFTRYTTKLSSGWDSGETAREEQQEVGPRAGPWV